MGKLVRLRTKGTRGPRRSWHGAHQEGRIYGRSGRAGRSGYQRMIGRARFRRLGKPWLFGGLILSAFAATFLLVFFGLGAWVDGDNNTAPQSLLTPASSADSAPERISFSTCGIGRQINCVVDGDTIWMRGEKIRLLGIDTPELSPSRCAEEERLGQAAKRRLHGLLNSGVVTLERDGRDRDRYGRLLRRVYVDGEPVGATLIAEGLARPYGTGRQPWC